MEWAEPEIGSGLDQRRALAEGRRRIGIWDTRWVLLALKSRFGDEN